MAFTATIHAQTAELVGSEWRPTEIGGVAIAEDAAAFVRFAEGGKVEGHGGCNRFAGTYKIDGGAIGFGPLAATRMMCPRPAMEIETGFFDALARAARFQRDRGTLELTGEDDAVVVRLQQTDAD